MSDLIDKLHSMPADEATAFAERMFYDMWGVTREELMRLSGAEITAIAEARGITVAGIGPGGKFSHEGDGKDHRN